MQTTAFAVEDDLWAATVARLGGVEALERSARETGALVRKRGVKSAEDLLRLVLVYALEGFSLRQLSAVAAAQAIAEISDVAWMNRFRGCGDWLMRLVDGLLGAAGDAAAGATARPVRLVDGSRIEGPGDSAWRLHLCWDAGQRRIVDLAFTPLSEGERLDRLALQPGEVRLGDAGLPSPGALRRARAAEADVLVRLTWNSLRLRDAAGAPLDWLALCRRSHGEGGVDMPVQVVEPRARARGRPAPLPMRLVLRPKPPQTRERAVGRARRAAGKDQRTADPRTLACAEHLIVLTSLEPQHLPSAEIAELYRVRWQIELAFKRLKSILRLDRLRATDPDSVRTWVVAHLLAALLIEDAAAGLAESSP